MDTFKLNGTLVGVESKEYDFKGRKGVSTKATVIIGKHIFTVKVHSDIVSELSSYSDEKGEFLFAISSFNLIPALMLIGFNSEK